MPRHLLSFALALLLAVGPAFLRGDDEVKVESANGRQALVAHNPYACAETITVRATLQNAKASQKLPLTVEVPAGATQELCTFSPEDTAKAWHYDYKWQSLVGSAASHHDDKAVYALPYPKGTTCEVAQGFHGKFSHTGEFDYAVDWGMPVGSQVCAARDGVVIKAKADSDEGGPTKEFLKKANVLTVLHADGTVGEYVHLKKDGILVKVGQVIHVGDVIALSGNTGFSSSPHLHFHVFIPVDGATMRTVPIKFRTGPEKPAVLKQGVSYTAP